MKLRFLTKKCEGKTELDVQAIAKMCLPFVVVLGLLISGCATAKIEKSEAVQQDGKKMDRTMYDLYYVEGLRLSMQGDLAEALDRFERALKIYPGSDAANYRISTISAMRRDYVNALKYGRRAAVIDPENQWYLMNIANIYIQQSMLDSATVWLEKVLELDESNEEERFRLGNIYMETGKPERAEIIFQDLYDKYGGNEQIMITLLDVKVRLEKYEDAEAVVKKEIENDPQNMSLMGLLAEIYAEAGEKTKAGEIYDKLMAMQQGKRNVVLSYLEFLMENREYEMLLERAERLIYGDEQSRETKIGFLVRMMQDTMLVNQYGGQIISFSEYLMENNEDDPTLVLLMAEVYSINGDTEQEIELLTAYIERDKSQYFIWERLLLLLNENEKIEMLYKYAGEAARLFNTVPLPKVLLAYCQIERKEYDEAANELKKVRILVNNQEQYLVQIIAMEAEIAYRTGKETVAFEKFDRALELESDNALVLNNYAYYLAEENIRLKEALSMIERCLEMERNITYLDTYAWVLYKLKRFREAERVMIEIFSSGDVQDAEIIEHYGYIKLARGDKKEAVKLWQAALKIDAEKTYLIEEIRKCIGEK
ncbi:MAG: tetratricopeptide repeat protein [Bacteroidales bacterium]|nr:tetratricopeptide repeat protein [Bacteroidales bacterium]